MVIGGHPVHSDKHSTLMTYSPILMIYITHVTNVHHIKDLGSVLETSLLTNQRKSLRRNHFLVILDSVDLKMRGSSQADKDKMAAEVGNKLCPLPRLFCKPIKRHLGTILAEIKSKTLLST